ncbi:MAG: hypothetical protein ACMUIG_09875 [Thermoplasmatota archaeon]
MLLVDFVPFPLYKIMALIILIPAVILGIFGIPAYIIGGYLIEGAQPYQIFQRAIELAKQKTA